jgi:ribosomal protein S18 acetylase RimI-like enzyme
MAAALTFREIDTERDGAIAVAFRADSFVVSFGTGVADELDAYVRELVRNAGFQRASLRVSPTNTRARAYYRKHGWIDRGLDPEHPNVHVMERPVERHGR